MNAKLGFQLHTAYVGVILQANPNILIQPFAIQSLETSRLRVAYRLVRVRTSPQPTYPPQTIL